MLNTYYRAHGILIPNSEELKLGDTRKFVTGALTIAPESGTYFNMHVLDFESLYPGCIDVFNLSYETIRCDHSECKENIVPGLDYNICTKKRGIYSALTGALRDLRLRAFKPYAKASSSNVDERMNAASRRAPALLIPDDREGTAHLQGVHHETRERPSTEPVGSEMMSGLPATAKRVKTEGYAVRPMVWPMLLRWDGCGWNRSNGMPTQQRTITVEA
jgi:hypothetical protein